MKYSFVLGRRYLLSTTVPVMYFTANRSHLKLLEEFASRGITITPQD
jgi:hypothetical protein